METAAKLKQRLRDEMLERLSSAEAAREAGDQAVAFFGASMAFKDARCVMLYMPLDNEPDTRPLLRDALDAGKRVALPRCYKDGIMLAHAVERGDMLTRSRYGIMEPDAGAPLIPAGDIDLILIPALAFDRMGYRLGRGAGYFDRYLATCAAKRAGVCYGFQIVDALIREKHDMRVDMLFTETGGFVTGG